jgi:hypothetical protein
MHRAIAEHQDVRRVGEVGDAPGRGDRLLRLVWEPMTALDERGQKPAFDLRP